MENLATNGIAIPRILRWDLAQINMEMVQSLVRSGFSNLSNLKLTQAQKVEHAILLLNEALSYSPEEKQRRKLFLDLGDLQLYFKKDKENSIKSYKKARQARKWSKSPDDAQIDYDFYLESKNIDSVGEIVIKSVSSQSLASFVDFRSSLLRNINRNDYIEDKNMIWKPEVGLGTVCEVQEGLFFYNHTRKITDAMFCTHLNIIAGAKLSPNEIDLTRS